MAGLLTVHTLGSSTVEKSKCMLGELTYYSTQLRSHSSWFI